MSANPDEIRRVQEANRRLVGLNLAAADMPAARRSMVAQIEREEAEAAGTAAAASDAAAERARIAAVIRLGRDAGKARQAAVLALASPIGPDAARAVLAGLPSDARAEPAALSLPATLPSFGTPAAQAECQRIAGILGHIEAADRFAVAADLALDPTMDAAGAGAVLALLPKSPLARLSATPLADRAAGLAEFGDAGQPIMGRGDRVTAGWQKAVQAANRAIGAGAVPSGGLEPAAGVPRSAADDPAFGLTPEARAALERGQA